MFESDLPNHEIVYQEIRFWKKFWLNVEKNKRLRTLAQTIKTKAFFLMFLFFCEDRMHMTSHFMRVRKKFFDEGKADSLSALTLMNLRRDHEINYNNIVKIFLQLKGILTDI